MKLVRGQIDSSKEASVARGSVSERNKYGNKKLVHGMGRPYSFG